MRPGSAGVPGCFLPSAPYFVMSGLDDVTVFDVSDPVTPREVGSMPSAQLENEAMNCGERKVSRERTDRFAMIGVDLYQASPDYLEHVNEPATGDDELVIVDVTDPTAPHVRSRVPATTSTHTMTCIDGTDCRYAYSAGDDSQVRGQGSFSVFDLTDLDHPVEVDSAPATPGTQPFRSDAVGWGGPKWNVDATGYATWGASEVWDSMWAPVYNRKGVATSRGTNLIYSVDLVRGPDVYVVDVPGDGNRHRALGRGRPERRRRPRAAGRGQRGSGDADAPAPPPRLRRTSPADG